MEKERNFSVPVNVALTGSTGNFGSYLLDLLIGRPEVKKVFCLNRSRDAQSRQFTQNEKRGLTTNFTKVVFFQADFGAANWGLGHVEVDVIVKEVDILIHNAWPVDFNRSFASFSPHVDGIKHLLELCRRRQNRNAAKVILHSPSDSSNESLDQMTRSDRTSSIKIIFVSSIGTVSNWANYAPTSRECVPEDELTDWKLARTGYGQSKLLAERLLAYADSNLGVPVTIARVGQLAGPVLRDTDGAWPAQEWFPSLIKSSKTLGALPDDLGPLDNVDFVPVDLAAQITLELIELGKSSSGQGVRSKPRKGAKFFHVVNPTIVPWQKLVPAVLRHYPVDLKVVSLVEWVDILKASLGEGGMSTSFRGVDEGKNPALKLLDSFEYMQDRAIRFPGARAAVLESKRTASQSSTLAALPAVSDGWMDLWMRQWDF